MHMFIMRIRDMFIIITLRVSFMINALSFRFTDLKYKSVFVKSQSYRVHKNGSFKKSLSENFSYKWLEKALSPV